MISLKRSIQVLVLCLIFACAYSNSYADVETGGKQVTTLNKKIDTSNLSGVNLWIAELYNDDRVLYAVVVVLAMALLGSIIAYGTDLVLRLMGISVGRISHRE